MNETRIPNPDKCRKCQGTWIGFRMTYINGEGPYCPDCMKRGIILKEIVGKVMVPA